MSLSLISSTPLLSEPRRSREADRVDGTSFLAMKFRNRRPNLNMSLRTVMVDVIYEEKVVLGKEGWGLSSQDARQSLRKLWTRLKPLSRHVQSRRSWRQRVGRETYLSSFEFCTRHQLFRAGRHQIPVSMLHYKNESMSWSLVWCHVILTDKVCIY